MLITVMHTALKDGGKAFVTSDTILQPETAANLKKL